MFIPNASNPDLNLFGTFKGVFGDALIRSNISLHSIDTSFPPGTPVSDVCEAIIQHLQSTGNITLDSFIRKCQDLGIVG